MESIRNDSKTLYVIKRLLDSGELNAQTGIFKQYDAIFAHNSCVLESRLNDQEIKSLAKDLLVNMVFITGGLGAAKLINTLKGLTAAEAITIASVPEVALTHIDLQSIKELEIKCEDIGVSNYTQNGGQTNDYQNCIENLLITKQFLFF